MAVTFTNAGPRLTPAELDALAAELRLPAAFRDWLASTNGGEPDRADFAIPGQGASTLRRLFSAAELRDAQRTFAGRVPEPWRPIGRDAGGNLVCIDADGAVGFWDHERGGVIYLARDLETFFAGLRAAPPAPAPARPRSPWPALLRDDPARFDAERKRLPATTRLDLRGADLSGLDLRGRRLERCDLTGADLRGAAVDPDGLATCRLQGANLDGLRTTPSGEELLRQLRLLWESPAAWNDYRKVVEPEPLVAADLSGADLAGADLSGVDLSHARLDGADLTGAKLDRASLVSADLAGAKLRGASLRAADLTDAELPQADLEGAVLDAAICTGAAFPEARLAGASLSSAAWAAVSAPGADLTGVTATRWMAGRSDLTGARLDRARLTDCDFFEADLTGASLRDATFERCLFVGTVGADFTGARR
jgi:uncharacterized protein YjbI with pentapeptide repeats